MYKIDRQYRTHRGLNYRRNNLNRPPEFATVAQNAAYRPSGAVSKRYGYQPHGGTKGGYGLYTYSRINPTTLVRSVEMLSVGRSGLARAKFTTLTVTYVGPLSPCYFSIAYNAVAGEYQFSATINTTSYQMSLGVPYDVVTPTTIASLVTYMTSIGLTVVSSGDTSIPAGFLTVTRNGDLGAGAVTLKAEYWEDVNTTVTNPFDTYYSHRNDSDFENMSAVVLSNVLYLSGGGYDWPQKYDGQTLFRMGLPRPINTNWVANGGATGSITGVYYHYYIRYVQRDAAGQVIEGSYQTPIFTPAASPPALVNDSFNVTFGNVLAASGFNTDGALVNGAQAGVNIVVVTAGHTMKVGDVACLKSGTGVITRNVTAITATSVTLDGATVTVANGDAISNNLTVQVFRTASMATWLPDVTTHYLAFEVPNNSFAATTVVKDSLSDAQIASNAIFVDSKLPRNLPTKFKYFASFQSNLIASGDLTYPRTVFWADAAGPEYWNTSRGQDCDSEDGGYVTGLAPTNDTAGVFTKKTVSVMSGDIANDDVVISLLTRDVGCEAHLSIKESSGITTWWSDKGPYYMKGGSIPRPLGEEYDQEGNLVGGRIDPIMDQSLLLTNQKLNFKRAVSFNDRVAKEYITFVPAEETQGGEVVSNSYSSVFVYNYDRDAWLRWINMDMTSGIALYNDEVFFQERHYSPYLLAVRNLLYRRLYRDEPDSYQDDRSAIDFDYGSCWEADGRPEAFKKFLRLEVYKLEETAIAAANVNPNTRYAQGTLRCDQEVDFIEDQVVATIPFEADTTGYGDNAYGVDTYGDPIADFTVRNLKRSKYKSTRFRFKNSEHQKNVIISGWDMEFATPYKPKVQK